MKRTLLSGAGLSVALLSSACGPPPGPSTSDIYHEAALRPSAIAAENDSQASLLTALSSADASAQQLQNVEVGRLYHAASDRRCRQVGPGLACESEDGSWSFVPPLGNNGE